jgi:hypothetical protein
MNNVPTITPEVGMGVTMSVGSDRYPYTIVEVINPSKKIIIQEDTARLVEGSAMSEHQKYEYAPNPEGKLVTLTKRKFGKWVTQGESVYGGSRFYLGERAQYLDPSF